MLEEILFGHMAVGPMRSTPAGTQCISAIVLQSDQNRLSNLQVDLVPMTHSHIGFMLGTRRVSPSVRTFVGRSSRFSERGHHADCSASLHARPGPSVLPNDVLFFVLHGLCNSMYSKPLGLYPPSIMSFISLTWFYHVSY